MGIPAIAPRSSNSMTLVRCKTARLLAALATMGGCASSKEEMNQAAAREKTTDLLSQIGNTPLLRLAALTRDLPGIEIYGKAEYFNPGGSVKDRPALNMIRQGECAGSLDKTKIILDATSGN